MKRDLIIEIADILDINFKDAEKALEAVTLTIIKQLQINGIVKVNDLGTFEIKKRKKIEGINLNNEKITIPEVKMITFRASSSLKKKVNKD